MSFGSGQDTALRFAALEVDREGLIVGWSVAAELMFGHSLVEMTDRRLASLLDGADPARLLQALPDSSTRVAVAQQMVCRRGNGETFHASILMTALDPTNGGAPRMVVLIVNDERDRNRDRFIASVAHDLRQPISVIETAAYVIEKLEKGAAQRMLNRIKTAAAQLHDLSAEILDVATARLGGEIVLEREHMNLVEIVDEVSGNLQLTRSDRLISIESADTVAGHWDRKRLRRLAQNLIENALAHSPPATAIRICCQRIGAEVVLTVENECPERPATILEDLFEPFRRASERGRSGLGLYIARELARAHGGEVTSSWSDGKITFTLSLPILVASRHDTSAPNETPSGAFSTQRRHRRLPLDSELEVGVRDQVFRARGRDISLRGLAFWSGIDLKVNERVQVGVSMGPTSFRVVGTVRHVNREADRSLVGIEFPCELSQVEIDLLKRPLRS
jgi:signal transduction histidine kinase